MFLARILFAKKKVGVKRMFFIFCRWFKRLKFLKCIQYHKVKGRVTTREELRICGAARRIQIFWKEWKRVENLKVKIAKMLLSLFRMRYAQRRMMPVQRFYSTETCFKLILTETDCKDLELQGESLDGIVLNRRNPPRVRYDRSPFMTNVANTMRHVGYIPIRQKLQATKKVIHQIDSILPRYFRHFPSRKKKTKLAAPPLERLVCVNFDTYEDFFESYCEIERRREEDQVQIYIFPLKLVLKLKAIIRIQAWWKGLSLRKG